MTGDKIAVAAQPRDFEHRQRSLGESAAIDIAAIMEAGNALAAEFWGLVGW